MARTRAANARGGGCSCGPSPCDGVRSSDALASSTRAINNHHRWDGALPRNRRITTDARAAFCQKSCGGQPGTRWRPSIRSLQCRWTERAVGPCTLWRTSRPQRAVSRAYWCGIMDTLSTAGAIRRVRLPPAPRQQLTTTREEVGAVATSLHANGPCQLLVDSE